MRENKMVYKFDYLPAGLFNRGQVSALIIVAMETIQILET